MTIDKNNSKTTVKPDPKGEKQARLAQALKDNLKRRKTQARKVMTSNIKEE